MPWDVIFAALGGSGLTAIVIVLTLTLAQKSIEQGVTSAGRRFESSLIKAENAYAKAVDLSAQIDVHLREQRIRVYGTIWPLTSLLPRWPRATNVTYADLLGFSERLRSWYFAEQGGMWLSTDARQAYGNLQEIIWSILPERGQGTISENDYDTAARRCRTRR